MYKARACWVERCTSFLHMHMVIQKSFLKSLCSKRKNYKLQLLIPKFLVPGWVGVIDACRVQGIWEAFVKSSGICTSSNNVIILLFHGHFLASELFGFSNHLAFWVVKTTWPINTQYSSKTTATGGVIMHINNVF